MGSFKKVRLMQYAWYGDRCITLSFPEEWMVQEFRIRGYDRPSLTPGQIRAGLRSPVGSKPLDRLAEGAREVAVLVDDLTRPTKAFRIIPFVLEELRSGGVGDDHVRFIMASGTHGLYTREEMVKKLGGEIVERYPVFNHNPYDCLDYLGETSRGTPVYVNEEVMSCDLKIGIGSILPYGAEYGGFSGGSKIILPGVSGIETIVHNHGRIHGAGALRSNADEAARMAGLDFKVDMLVNRMRDPVELVAGDFAEAWKAGTARAVEHYACEYPLNMDVVVANVYCRPLQPEIVLWTERMLRKGGDLVIVWMNPRGVCPHYVYGKWGVCRGDGRLWKPPERRKRAGRVIVYTEHLSWELRARMGPPDQVVCLKNWEEVLEELRNRHGRRARVAVLSDASVLAPLPLKPDGRGLLKRVQ